MDLVWKTCAVGILCAFAAIILKSVKGEFGAFVRIGGGILLLATALPILGQVMGDTGALFAETDMGIYADAMLRAIGIALLTRICTDVCRDVGEGAIASGVELAGKIAILVLCLPMIREILGYAAEILQEAEG